jgi:glycosyltransferase involved in cell wall biosynthesis
MPEENRMNFVVFSHLRWDFVFQRPQHLMTRCALTNDVLFCEEPVFDGDVPIWHISGRENGVEVAVPHIPAKLAGDSLTIQRQMIGDLLERRGSARPVLWFYTPMATLFTSAIRAEAVIYDCMDELSAFRGAPPGLRAAEEQLFERCDLVFTGGRSLFEAKRRQHPSVHCFPSSIDRDFFARARGIKHDPADQSRILHPRIGYCGVIDERMDMELIAYIADQRPAWNLVLLGPVVKIGPAELPARPNIHYLGPKPYADLPSYLGNWDVALLPFAQNDSTKFISPTKTPEYLAAGLPVVSTPIADVIRPYGEQGLVLIAPGADEFVVAIERALASPASEQQIDAIDHFLAQNSWDATWDRMEIMIREVAAGLPRAAGGSLVDGRSVSPVTIIPNAMD